MRIIIDTNCFLAILPKKSIYRPIFDAYRQGRFELAVSSEILDEYAEIFEQKMTTQISENILELIMKQPNSLILSYQLTMITLLLRTDIITS